jgi:GT2 family glycosyltransferase
VEESPKTLAVVLTYAAPEALDRCLAAIAAQTHRAESVLVVDNASPEPARPADVGVPCETVRTDCNTGPAGGHAVGLKYFLHSDCTVAWVMDDDCVPAPDCLERLLERLAASPTESIVLPWWIDGVTGEGQFSPAWCGFALPKIVVEKVGLPRPELVWWAEDTEYVRNRMDRAGVLTHEERGAVVEHRRVRDAGPRPVWKVYYEARNTVYYRLYVHSGKVTFNVRRMLRALGKLFVGVMLDGDRRLEKSCAFMRGVVDGARKRLGVRVPLER